MGLGHAILCAKHLINDEAFAVLLPDVFILDSQEFPKNYSFKRMVTAWNKFLVGQVMVETVSPSDVDKFGIVDLKKSVLQHFESKSIEGLTEKPSKEMAASPYAAVGRYILPSGIMNYLEKTIAGKDGEIQLTDALNTFTKDNELHAFLTSAKIFDCGSKEGFLGANLSFGMRQEHFREYLIKLFGALS